MYTYNYMSSYTIVEFLLNVQLYEYLYLGIHSLILGYNDNYTSNYSIIEIKRVLILEYTYNYNI